ncbi:MAG: metallophosphoesterase [Nitrososphaeraceae archaeon]|nr:metallophosphoesterase [Nitrososphaeraceae archaeon]
MPINKFRNIGYIIGFVTIFLVFSSNLLINQNHLLANSLLNKGSFEQLDRYRIIPIKDKEGDVEISSLTSNPNLQELKNNLCKNNVVDNLGIPLCNPLDNKEKKSTNDNNDGNDDTNKKEEKKLLKQQQQEDKSKEQQQQQEEDKSKEQQQQEEEDKSKEQNYNNDNGDGNVDKSLGIAGLNLNIESKGADLNKKIDKLKDKILGEDNQYFWDQQEENKVKNKNSKNENNDGEKLGISGLNLKIQKIDANLEKKIEKLKDKIENDEDNQRLIDQRQENEAKDDDDDDDDDDKHDGDTKEGDDETYDGYRFNGDNGNDNGNDNDNDNDNDNGNDDNNFNFATAGDFGCSKNTQNTVSNMERKNPELVLALGDLSYHSTADCWFDIMSPLKGKMMITLGHHDIKDGEAKMNQYVKSFELDKPYYSYDYKHVHFLVMASLSDYKQGSEQYNFIKQDLEKASQNEDTNWIIVSTYKPLYSSPSEHPAEDSLRDAYNPLFEKYGVDLVLNGHNHNYQRTYPLTYNPNESAKPVTTSELSTGYNRGNDGIVFATVGTGGVNFYSLEGKNPYVANQFAGKFGFLDIDISNGNPHTKLTGTFYDNKGSEIADEFTIEKEIKNKKSAVSYS